ncbi:MAG: serpin family protein [Chitinophagales bacterium]
MKKFQSLASKIAIVFTLVLFCSTLPIQANPLPIPKNIKHEKVLGYQLYPYIELKNNTFFVIQDEITWQQYFMSNHQDLRSSKVVDLDFKDEMAIVIFKKTHEIWKLNTKKVTNQNGNLYVAYEANIIGVNAFKTSSFLHIIKVKKNEFKNVRFFENHIPITDIPVDEKPIDAIPTPITFVPELEEKLDTDMSMDNDHTEEMMGTSKSEMKEDPVEVDNLIESGLYRENPDLEEDDLFEDKMKDIRDTDLEEDDLFEDEKVIMTREEAAELQKKKEQETSGINNTEPSIKDKLAQIEEESEAMAEEQNEEIDATTSPYKTHRMAKVDETTNAAMEEMAESNQQFGFNVFEQLTETESGNIVFSPFALSTALAMSYAGAREATEAQMLQTLQFHQSSKNLHKNYENLLAELVLDGMALNNENTGTELVIGNAMWLDDKFQLNDPYSDIARKNYRGSLRNVKFKDKDVFLEELNNWMKVKTAYNILDEVPTDFKPNESAILLTNTLHLKTKWDLPFDRSITQAAAFKLTEEKSLQVNMMHTEDTFGYFENSMVKTIAIPCNDDYTMLVLIPKAYFQLKAVQKTLMRGGYTHWLTAMKNHKVRLSLPRFSFNTQVDMVAPLEKIGMTEPFDKKADFSGMFNKRNAPIGDIFHPTHIHINESGISTEENSNTSRAGNWTESDEESEYIFEANRPFMFLIIDNNRKHLLMMGKVMEPELAE